MNKTEIISNLSEKAGLTKTDANKALDAMLETIGGALSTGQDVRLAGFGNFSVTTRAARKGRNPRTGDEIEIPSCRVIKFKAGKSLRDQANNK